MTPSMWYHANMWQSSLYSYLKGLVPSFNEGADKFIEGLRPLADGKTTVPMKEHLAEVTQDVISKVQGLWNKLPCIGYSLYSYTHDIMIQYSYTNDFLCSAGCLCIRLHTDMGWQVTGPEES